VLAGGKGPRAARPQVGSSCRGGHRSGRLVVGPTRCPVGAPQPALVARPAGTRRANPEAPPPVIQVYLRKEKCRQVPGFCPKPEFVTTGSLRSSPDFVRTSTAVLAKGSGVLTWNFCPLPTPHTLEQAFSRLLCKLVTSRFVQNAFQRTGFKM
jgi:hypothetical protein